MKKWLFFLVCLLLIVAAPLSIGVFMKKHYQVALETISNNSKFDFKIINYHRGWLKSTVTAQTNFPLTDQPLNDNKLPHENTLNIKQYIYHGPIIVNKNGVSFALATVDTYSGNTKLATTALSYTGHLKTKINIANLVITKQHSNEILFAVRGAKGIIDWNLMRDKFATAFQVQHLLANLIYTREIYNFAEKSQLNKTTGGLWIGRVKYHFDQLTWRQAEDQYSFDQFDYNVNNNIDNGVYNTLINGNVKNVSLNSINYGTQKISLAIKDINQTAAEKFLQEFPLKKMHLMNPYQFNDAKNQLLALIQQGAVVQMDYLQLNTAFGAVNLAGNFRCPCQQPSDQNFQDMRASLQGKIPVALADKILIDLYTLKLRTNDGSLTYKEVVNALTKWQNEGWLTNAGSDLFINYKWQSNDKKTNNSK